MSDHKKEGGKALTKKKTVNFDQVTLNHMKSLEDTGHETTVYPVTPRRVESSTMNYNLNHSELQRKLNTINLRDQYAYNYSTSPARTFRDNKFVELEQNRNVNRKTPISKYKRPGILTMEDNRHGYVSKEARRMTKMTRERVNDEFFL
uniref:Uncharacterized protein n=1 Tax=Cacopsylla melanoneura TaxID=428564 RepID=A0A8D8ZG64_9HEMI